jgi:integrase/recombinase XerD
MSGGPYGRGKAPERQCLKLHDWPDADRQLWEAATRPSDLLDPETGARSSHAAKTNAKAEKGYGRWLTFLGTSDPQALAELPAERITPARVRAYIETLQALGNATGTILARLQELGEVARVLDPCRDWGFINRLASRIRAAHQPARAKTQLKLSDDLLDLGRKLVAEAETNIGLDAAILHRDGLLIGFLSLLPLRRKNVAALELGKNLISTAGSWSLVLTAEDTKTHRHLELPVPDLLTALLIPYLDIHRSVLLSRTGRWTRPAGQALWISKDGSPMTEITLYDRIRARTEAAFGLPLNPHLLRDAAATTLAIADPAHVRVAAPLLGHASFATTEKYYQQATAMSAHRQYIDAIFGRKEDEE